MAGDDDFVGNPKLLAVLDQAGPTTCRSAAMFMSTLNWTSAGSVFAVTAHAIARRSCVTRQPATCCLCGNRIPTRESSTMATTDTSNAFTTPMANAHENPLDTALRLAANEPAQRADFYQTSLNSLTRSRATARSFYGLIAYFVRDVKPFYERRWGSKLRSLPGIQ